MDGAGLRRPGNIGYLEDCWNDFDHLDDNTRLIHNTKRRTQPWKTGLPVDYTPANKFKNKPLLASLNRLRAKVFGEYGLLGRYQEHPDKSQEAFFFGLLKECMRRVTLLRSWCGRKSAKTTSVTMPLRCWTAPRNWRQEPHEIPRY